MRILEALLPVWRQSPEELFLGEELIEVNCPRCGKVSGEPRNDGSLR